MPLRCFAKYLEEEERGSACSQAMRNRLNHTVSTGLNLKNNGEYGVN